MWTATADDLKLKNLKLEPTERHVIRRPKRRWVYNIKMDLKYTGCKTETCR